MAFKLAKSPTFKATVTIETQDDKGRTEKETVVATYRRCNEDELSDLEGKKNAEVCRLVLINVEGMVDQDRQPVPYEGDNVEALLMIPPATFALAAAFWQGSRMGRAKN